MRALTRAAAAATALLLTGFGTVNTAGQNAEHERITRLALQCGPDPVAWCVHARTLDELAGARGSFGAIGAPDRGTLLAAHEAHCDGGDHLPTPGYPQSAADARQALVDCRAWMAEKLAEAVEDAGALLDAQGRIHPGQGSAGCRFVGGFKGRAKCNVLEDMGVLMHAAQDFYSHSNWVDRPAPGPVTPDNPPGLGHDIAAPFLDLRAERPFPEGLISGCFVALPESAFCRGRVRHAALNKDNGLIDPATGAVTSPATPRGQLNGNFERAVRVAVEDTADKWATLREALIARYGHERGERMMCALAADDPVRDCA